MTRTFTRALGLAGMLAVTAMVTGSPAFAQYHRDDRGHGDWHRHEAHARDWRYHHRYVQGGPGYVYTPPAVVYAPPPGPPSLNVFIPLHF